MPLNTLDTAVTVTDWTDISTPISGVTTTALFVQNKGAETIVLFDSATKPDVTSFNGMVLGSIPSGAASYTIPSGWTKIWARAVRKTSTVHAHQ